MDVSNSKELCYLLSPLRSDQLVVEYSYSYSSFPYYIEIPTFI